MKKRVLIIDDNLNICRQIKDALQNETTDVDDTVPTDQALSMFSKQSYCLVIMDIHLTNANGMSLLSAMRKSKSVPILVLSHLPDPKDRIKVLDAGATAIVEKPFDQDECAAYARALMNVYLNREKEGNYYTLAFGMKLIIDYDYRCVLLDGQPAHLTAREFELLYYLASQSGQVLSREQIYSHVWRHESGYDIDETVKACIKTLRKKLKNDEHHYIENVRGVGYRFVG